MNQQKTFDNSNTTSNSKQLEILKTNFPQCFDKNGDFIADKMQELVQQTGLNLSKESYSLNWLGKSYARLLANEQPLTLLKEDTQHNQKPINKNSENLLIKGDNLEVLKHLRNAYSQSIKMIYIDPPYNTGGGDFVYQDNRKFTNEQLQRLAGLEADDAQRILDFTNSKSNSHSAWLTFIYPRLYIARELLTDDGVIFISIDDNEQAQLKLLCDEVFGEENFVGNIIWEKRYGRSNNAKLMTNSTEHVVLYRKSSLISVLREERDNNRQDGYSNPDNDYRGVWTSVSFVNQITSEARPNLTYTIKNPNTGEKINHPTNAWKVGEEKYKTLLKENRLHWGTDGKAIYPRIKRFLSELDEGMTPINLWKHKETGTVDMGTKEIKELMKFDAFTFPKPTKLIKRMLSLFSPKKNKNGIILDFFAGSGTTADAVMQLNAQDGGNRKFIMVQLDESIDENKNKTAYDFVKNELGNNNPTIFDICKERIIRAAKKIQIDNKKAKAKDKKDLSKQDFGFKVFATLPMFKGYFDAIDELDEQQDLFDGTQLSDEDLEALLTSWIVNDGVKLSAKTKTIILDTYKADYVDNKLYLMDKGWTTNDLQALLEKLDDDKDFQPNTIILFGYNFESKHQREISEALSSYKNKKQIELDRVIRY